MRVKSRVLKPFIAKKVEGIFGYDILLYGFLFRRQWVSFSQSFARIGLLFIKWRVEHKATRARGLSRSGLCARFHTLQYTSSGLHSKNKKEYIITFRTHFDIFTFNTSLHYNIKYYFLKKYGKEIIK